MARIEDLTVNLDVRRTERIAEEDDISSLYRHALNNVLLFGKEIAPRGMKTKEICGASLRLNDARKNLLVSEPRKLNYYFSVAESLWMLLGQNDVASVSAFNSRLAQFSDDGIFFRGAYGPKITEQIPYVLENLRSDTSSRQAVLSVWRERPRASKDIPCTVAMQFLLREDKLNMITTMRSNDLWLGFPYDVYSFTQVQSYVAGLLGVDTGWYEHNVGSLHIYETNYDGALEVINHDIKASATWHPKSPLLTEMPPGVRAFFNTIAARGPEIEKDFLLATQIANDVKRMFDKPWSTLLLVLLTRWVRQNIWMNDPWSFLLDRCCGIPLKTP